MQRSCSSLLRNGILKAYPPVLIRLGVSGASHYVNKENQRSWHNNNTNQKSSDDHTNCFNAHHEEELRKTCVQMIDQCQMMVKKLQLHCNRSNSKYGHRKNNPRNTKNLDSRLDEMLNICNPHQQPTLLSECCEEKSVSDTEQSGRRLEQVGATVAYGTTSCAAGKQEENVPSVGPKVLHMCSARKEQDTTVSASSPLAYRKGRGSTRKCVHSARKCVSDRNSRATQLSPQDTRPTSISQEALVETEEHIVAFPCRSVASATSEHCSNANALSSTGCRSSNIAVDDDASCGPSNNNRSNVPVRIGSGMILRRDSDECAVADGARSRIPVNVRRFPSLPLQDTPMQTRLRAEERARAKRPPTQPPRRSQAERAVDAICESTISCFESLGRLPRILQSSSVMHQCSASTATQRCAKNSMRNLPTSGTQLGSRTMCEKSLLKCPEAIREDQHKRVPPKILADYEVSKQLYTRRAHVGSAQRKVHHKNVTRPSIVQLEGGGGKRQQQHTRRITTSNQVANAKSNEKDGPCSDKTVLEPICKRKIKRAPLCRPPPLDDATCTAAEVPGPCQGELHSSSAPPTTPSNKQNSTDGVKGANCPASKARMKKAGLSFKSPDHCQMAQKAGPSSGICDAAANSCYTPPLPTSRLRYPPVPRHLLKREVECLQVCAPTESDLSRRPMSNCERMIQDKAKQKDIRPPDPMKQPRNKCVEMRHCKQEPCAVLHSFPPPPRNDKYLPEAVLPYPVDLCGDPDPDAVPPWDDERNISAPCTDETETEVKCNLRRPLELTSGGAKNTCAPYPSKPKPPPPYCTYRDDKSESFECLTEAHLAHPAYPDPICPPMRPSRIKPQKVKYLDVLKQVPCAKKPLTCEERLDVDTYCDPCYRAKEMHAYSDTAYYDLNNYMAGRRRMPPGPNRSKRRGKPWKDEPPC